MSTPEMVTADEAKAMRLAATGGPWRADYEFGLVQAAWDNRAVVCTLDHEACRDTSGADLRLIAHAPDLAATVVALHDEVAAVTFQRDEARAHVEKVVRLELCETLDRLGGPGLGYALRINGSTDAATWPTVTEIQDAIWRFVQEMEGRAVASERKACAALYGQMLFDVGRTRDAADLRHRIESRETTGDDEVPT